MQREDDAPPPLTDDERALVEQIRAMPREGEEPDWLAMQRQIRARVGDRVPRPWWRGWRLGVPLAAFAAAVAAVLVFVHARPAAELPTLPREPIAVQPPVREAPAAKPETMPLWLDGEQVDIDLATEDALGVLPAEPAEEDDAGALVPASDYAWVEDLDPAALAKVEQWLAKGDKI